MLQVFESAPGAVKLPVVIDETDEDPIQEQDIMSDEELKEAQDQLAERDATIARLQETLLLQEAAVFVAEALVKVELPDITRARLAKQLQSKPAYCRRKDRSKPLIRLLLKRRRD